MIVDHGHYSVLLLLLLFCAALIVGLVCSMALIIGSVIAVVALLSFRRLGSTEYFYQL